MADHRKKWDREEFEKIATSRLEKESQKLIKKKSGQKREMLKTRDYKIDLTSKLGKTTIINKNTPMPQSGGYYCNVCDCLVKDSINFLDHINGKKHQRNNGMSMRISRSTVEQVKQRFAYNKRKLEEKQREYDLTSRLEQIAQEEEKLREYRREKRRENKRKIDDVPSDHPNNDLADLMGFSGFGSSKKQH